jgi:hypothetical protein
MQQQKHRSSNKKKGRGGGSSAAFSSSSTNSTGPVLKLLSKERKPTAVAGSAVCAVSASVPASSSARLWLAWADGRMVMEDVSDAEGVLVVALVCRGVAHGSRVFELLTGRVLPVHTCDSALQVWLSREPGVLWLLCLGSAPPSPSAPPASRDERMLRLAQCAHVELHATRDTLTDARATTAARSAPFDESARMWLARLLALQVGSLPVNVAARLRALT